MSTNRDPLENVLNLPEDNKSFLDYLSEASKMYLADKKSETKPIMLVDPHRIELKTVKQIELISNYETHLKENYQIEIPEYAMVNFFEKNKQ